MDFSKYATHGTMRSIRHGCPICGSQSRGRNRGGKECKEIGSSLVLCITGKEMSTPPGWRYKGDDRNGIFGIFYKENNEWKEEYERENQQRKREWIARQQKMREDRGKIERYVGVKDRHQKIQKLLELLILNDSDKEYLLKRGLTEEEIEIGGYRSTRPNSRLPGYVGELFGIGIEGNKILAQQKGIVCPFKDFDGNWIGWQLRLTESNCEGGKYRWPVSTRTDRNPGGLSVHFELNEEGKIIDRSTQSGFFETRKDEVLPLACYDVLAEKNQRSNGRNEDECSGDEDSGGDNNEEYNGERRRGRKSWSEFLTFEQKLETLSNREIIEDSIGLTEGTAFKPFITSSRLNCLTIGASGGNFTSNPRFFLNLFNNGLSFKHFQHPQRHFILFPDAGAVENLQVLNQYSRLIGTLIDADSDPLKALKQVASSLYSVSGSTEMLDNLQRQYKDAKHEIRIAWWGQTTKGESFDIDEALVRCKSKEELENFIESIKFLTWSEFFDLAIEATAQKAIESASLKHKRNRTSQCNGEGGSEKEKEGSEKEGSNNKEISDNRGVDPIKTCLNWTGNDYQYREPIPQEREIVITEFEATEEYRRGEYEKGKGEGYKKQESGKPKDTFDSIAKRYGFNGTGDSSNGSGEELESGNKESTTASTFSATRGDENHRGDENGKSASAPEYRGIELDISKSLMEKLVIATSHSRHDTHKLIEKLEALDRQAGNAPESLQQAIETREIKKQIIENKIWNKKRKFTPHITINKRYLPNITPRKGFIHGIASPMGTGKTETIKTIVENIDEIGATGAIIPGSRNSLLIQTSERVGAYHLHNDNAAELIKDKDSIISLCVDSLWRYSPDNFDNKLVIVDEANSVVEHLLIGGTISQKRCLISELITEMVIRSHSIILFDANLTDETVNYFHRLSSGTKEVEKVKNEFKLDPVDIFFMADSVDEESLKKSKTDRSGMVKAMLDSLGSGEKISIPTDSQIFAEAMDNLLQTEGYQGIRLDSKTTADPIIKEMLKTINEVIESQKPDYLIFTPSCESGVDINIKNYFTSQYALFTGVLTTDSQLQMLKRVRFVNRWTINCKERASQDRCDRYSRSIYLEELAATKLKRSFMEIDELERLTTNIDGEVIEDEIDFFKTFIQNNAIEQIIRQVSSPHHEHCLHIQSKKNYEALNLRACLIQRLSEAGNRIHDWSGITNEELKERVKNESNEVRTSNCNQIFEAEEITEAQAQQIRYKVAATWEDRCKAEKAYLTKIWLPGIDKSPVWSEEFIKQIKYDEPSVVNRLTSRWFCGNKQMANRALRDKWASIFKKNGNFFLNDLRESYLQTQALEKLGILDMIEKAKANPEITWQANSPEIQKALEIGKQPDIATALGFRPLASRPFQYVGKCLDLLAYELKTKVRKIQGTDKNETVGRIDPDSFEENNQTYLAILNAIDRRVQSKLGGIDEREYWQQTYSTAIDAWKGEFEIHPPRTRKEDVGLPSPYSEVAKPKLRSE